MHFTIIVGGKMADKRRGYAPETALREQVGIEERQAQVAKLYFIEHKDQREVATILGVSQQTISLDIKKIRAEYARKRLDRLQEYLNVELAKLDAVEREAWSAWERSIGKARKIVKKRNSNGDWEESESEEDLVGDPRFLTQVQAAVDRRIRLLGLDAPQEVMVNSMEGRLTNLIKTGKVTYEMLVREIGVEQARRYFNLAGATIPDIVDGEYDYIDTPDVVTEYLAEGA